VKYLEAKVIASTFPKELGFVNRAALQASENAGELEVIAGIGFCNYHHRRDGQTTIYEIAVAREYQNQGWGRLLFYRVLCACIERSQTRIVAKCPEDNLSNGFYEHLGFKLVIVESGRRRRLNRWQFNVKLPFLFYCADGGRNWYSVIASSVGWMLGLRSDQAKTPQHCQMVDNHWTGYDHKSHLAAVQHHKPLVATARDLEHPDQLSEILRQAGELQKYAGRVLLIPKCKVLLPSGYWLAYSVPTQYGGTDIECKWFGQRHVHLLGGSPNAKHLNVVSLDGNYAMNLARHGTATWQGQEIKRAGSCYEAFELSIAKQKAYWHPEKPWHWSDEPLFAHLKDEF
jgi:GNAT superfamily N-acetyltransferase